MKHLSVLILLVLVPALVSSKTLYCDLEYEGRTITEEKVTHPSLKSCGTTDDEHVVAAAWCLPKYCLSRTKCKNKLYKQFYKDPINLVPALSCVNRSRGKKPYGEIPGEKTNYIGCDLEFTKKVFEPPQDKWEELGLRTLVTFELYGSICREPYKGYLDLMRKWATPHQ